MFDKPTPTMLYPLEKPGIPLSSINFHDMTKKLRNCSIFLLQYKLVNILNNQLGC